MLRLVLARVMPRIDAEDLCKIVGITPDDVRAAIERRKRRDPKSRKPVRPDDRRIGSRPSRMRTCQWCDHRTTYGLRMQRHCQQAHPVEYAAWLKEIYTERCPDCGEVIVEVEVTVNEHVCKVEKTEVEHEATHQECAA